MRCQPLSWALGVIWTVDFMKIIYVLTLILLVSLHANAASFSPYKLSYGEDVILEIDNKGRVVYSKGSSFCEKIKNNDAYDIVSFNERFDENTKTKRHLEVLCKSYFNKVENEYSVFHRLCNADVQNQDLKETCSRLRKGFDDVVKKIEFLSSIYHSIKMAEVEKENNRILEESRKRKEEISATCNNRYDEVLKNDRLGIDEINESIVQSQDINHLVALRDYRFMVFSLPSECRSQERYSSIIKSIELAKKNLSISIGKLQKDKKDESAHHFNNKSVKKENYFSIDEYTDKMASYATLLGRAAACNINIESEIEKVGFWMDSWFDSLNIQNKERSMYLLTFMNGTEFHAKQQLSGQSPDNCEQVIRAFRNTRWP